MTLSGTHTLAVTRNDIILAALEDIGAYAPGMETPQAGEISAAANRLNYMIKAWQAAGVGLWLKQWYTLPLQGGRQYYEIGPGGDHCSRMIFWQTLSAGATSGALTITLTDADSVDAADRIGIATDSGYMFWTTVNGAPVGDVVTLTAALTAAASAGNLVYFYAPADIAPRPIEVLGVNYWTPTGTLTEVAGLVSADYGQSIPLTSISRQEYMALPNPASTGPPTMFYYNPVLGDGQLYVWPMTTDMGAALLIDARVPIQVFTALGDSPDFPAEWFDALHYGLALRLCPAYKVPPNDYMRLKEMAAMTLDAADGFDREQGTSVFISPAFWPGG